jgi:hypothetical protein
MSSDDLFVLLEEQFGSISETDFTQSIVLEDMCLLEDLALSQDVVDVFRQVVECCSDSARGVRFIKYYAKNDKSKFGKALNNLAKFLIDYAEVSCILKVREALENEPTLKTTLFSLLRFTFSHFPDYEQDELALSRPVFSYVDEEYVRSYWPYMDETFWCKGFNQQSFQEWFDDKCLQGMTTSNMFQPFYDHLCQMLVLDGEQEILIYDPCDNENVSFSTQVIIGNTFIVIVGTDYDL